MSAVSIIGIQISGLCASSHSSLTGGGRPPSCSRLMLSRPPATITSASPVMMRCAANAMVCRPDEQKRLTVTPGTVTGRPARIADRRAIFCPVARSGMAQPITTSSTSPGSTPARSTACLTTWPPSTAPWVMLKAPRNALPIGVRAVETITASGMLDSLAAVLLDQLLLRQFADGGARQCGADFEGGRHLMATDLVNQEIAQRVKRQGRCAGLELDEGLGGFAPVGILDADHQRFFHVRVLVDRLLDHLRIDVEAARKDHVLLAVENEEVAVFIHGADVAAQKTAIRKGCGRFVRPVPVALHHVLALDPQLADIAGAEHTVRIVERHHLDRDARQRKPNGPGLCRPAERRADAGRRGFGHSPAARQRQTPNTSETFRKLDGKRRPAGGAAAQ